MSNKKNDARPWTDDHDALLMELAAEATPAWTIAQEMDRTMDAVQSRASQMGICLPLSSDPIYQ